MSDLEKLADLKKKLLKLDNKIIRVGLGSTDNSKGKLRTFESNYQSLTIERRELEGEIYKLEEKLKNLP